VDQGDGYAAIDEIRFAEEPVPPRATSPLVRDWLSHSDWSSLAAASSALDASLARGLAAVTSPAPPTGSRVAVLNWLHRHDLLRLDDLDPVAAAAFHRARQLATNVPRPRYALAMAQGTREPAAIAIRGNPHNPGETVPARFLEALGGVEGDRLTLAHQIASPENPLTARSIVNRLWHHLFGRGLVPTVDDFGPMGQPPSHPELLDWLAADFLAHGWSIKHTLKTIVTSRTYQQSSLPHPSLDPGQIETADPTNALLHRAPVRRLPAEAIRDSILAVSGRLDDTMFGTSVPTHRTAFMTGRGARKSGPLDGDGRRTVYLSIYRNFLNPFLLTFDLPNPFGPKGRRSVSNVPAQSLALLNDPFVQEQSRIWAERVLRREATAPERIDRMIRTAFARPATERERAWLTRFLEEHPGPEKAAWSDLAHLLYNRKEFLYLR